MRSAREPPGGPRQPPRRVVEYQASRTATIEGRTPGRPSTTAGAGTAPPRRRPRPRAAFTRRQDRGRADSIHSRAVSIRCCHRSPTVCVRSPNPGEFLRCGAAFRTCVRENPPHNTGYAQQGLNIRPFSFRPDPRPLQPRDLYPPLRGDRRLRDPPLARVPAVAAEAQPRDIMFP